VLIIIKISKATESYVPKATPKPVLVGFRVRDSVRVSVDSFRYRFSIFLLLSDSKKHGHNR